MAYNEQTYKASQKYKAKKVKRVPLDMQISDYELLKAAADEVGEGINTYIKRAISERIERDQAQPTKASAQQEPAAEEQPTKPKSFLDSIRAEVEEIVAETEKNTEEEDWK